MKLTKREIPILGKTYDALEHSFIVLDEQYHILYLNEFAKEIFGFTEEDIASHQCFITLLANNNLHQLWDNDKKSVNPQPIRINNYLRKWELIPGSVSKMNSFFLFDKDATDQEEIYDVLARAANEVTGQVFTERLAVQEYLDEIRGCLESVIKQMPCYVYWKDKNFHYIFCNEITADIMGLNSAEEAVGKTDYDFGWDQELVDGYRETDKKIIATGTPVLNLEEDLIDKNGRVYRTLVNKMPLRNKKGETIGILGITVDVTGVKKAEIAKADFISNMEHDLKTPFSGIGGIANVLYGMETNPEKKALLELMITSCHQWENVHHRIFDSLAVDQPQNVYNEPVSISKELTEIYEMMLAILHMKKLDFVITPVPVDLDQIETDKSKFRLILSSLISNAINFTEQGMVTITTSREQDYCSIKVIDTGVGIPSDKFEVIFEKFSKLSRSNKYGGDFKGVGLGLFIAKQYAQQLEATITVESVLGKGSIFTLKLPLKKQHYLPG